MINAVYDLVRCTRADLEPTDLLDAMRATVDRLGCTVLGELPVLFQPHGLTCVLVLAESHLTVATWPEHQLAHVDLFTCRTDSDPENALTPIVNALGATHVHGQRIRRIDPSGLSAMTTSADNPFDLLQS
jgi:S-adenosylmethionine decarboxylase